jgi:hypothetical protein
MWLLIIESPSDPCLMMALDQKITKLLRLIFKQVSLCFHYTTCSLSLDNFPLSRSTIEKNSSLPLRSIFWSWSLLPCHALRLRSATFPSNWHTSGGLLYFYLSQSHSLLLLSFTVAITATWSLTIVSPNYTPYQGQQLPLYLSFCFPYSISIRCDMGLLELVQIMIIT